MSKEDYIIPTKNIVPKEWVSLSDDEILVIYESMSSKPRIDGYEWDYARAIEQALKEKNT